MMRRGFVRVVRPTSRLWRARAAWSSDASASSSSSNGAMSSTGSSVESSHSPGTAISPSATANSTATSATEGSMHSQQMQPQPQPQQTYHLDTYRLSRVLEQRGFTADQSEAVTRVLAGVLAESVAAVERATVTKIEAEQETHAYQMALHALKVELSTLRKTETAALQSSTAGIQRELDLVSLKFREDFGAMRGEVQLDMNARKAEAREERQKQEISIQQLSHRLTISMSEIKTLAESMKLNLITKWASGIAFATTATVVIALKLV